MGLKKIMPDYYLFFLKKRANDPGCWITMDL